MPAVTPPVITRTSVATQVPPSSKGAVVKTTGTPSTYSSLLGGAMTPAQFQQQLAAEVAAAQLPQTQALQQAQTSDAATAKAQEAATTGYYQALAQALQSIAPQVNQGYNTASANDAAIAKGYADGLQHVQSLAGQQNNAVLNVSGGTQQAGQVAQATGGPAEAGALYGMTGAIPATNLSNEGAAFGAAASMMPATAAGLGAQQIQRVAQQEQVNQNQFAQQKSDLAAQVPGLQLNYGNQLLTQEDNTQQKQFQNLIAAGINPYTGQPTYQAASSAASTAAKTGAATKPDATLSRALGYEVDSNGSPIGGKITPIAGYKLGTNGTIVKDAAPGAQATAVKNRGNATAKASDYILSTATKALGYKQIGQKPETKSRTLKVGSVSTKQTLYLRKDGTYTTNKNDPGIVYQPIYDKGTKNADLSQSSYSQVLKESVDYLKTNLARYGYSDADLAKMAAQILAPLAPEAPAAAPATTAPAVTPNLFPPAPTLGG